jgi:hypothetical protein
MAKKCAYKKNFKGKKICGRVGARVNCYSVTGQ